jgi:predicted nucleotidyltransferase
MSNPIIKHGEVITADVRSKISTRYKTVTRAVNNAFRGIHSDTQYSFYVGSYGRGTAINTSDIDILVELPENEYMRHDALKGNGQSRLLQAVKDAILASYPRSDVRADGQVVKINFSDGILFEILPAFQNLNWLGQWDGTYKYPDSNMGGNWHSTNPKAAIEAIDQKNSSSNGLLKDTCKHLRRVRNDNYSSYTLSGIVIDSFVYKAMGNWRWLNEDETSTSTTGDYEKVLLNNFLINKSFFRLTAPGSGDFVDTSGSIFCLEKVLRLIAE